VPVPKTKGPNPDDQSPRFTMTYSMRNTLSLMESVPLTFVFMPRAMAVFVNILFNYVIYLAIAFAWARWFQNPGKCCSIPTCTSCRRIEVPVTPKRSVVVFVAARALDADFAALSAYQSNTKVFMLVVMAWRSACNMILPKLGKYAESNPVRYSNKAWW